MKTRKYIHQSDFAEISEWYTNRGLSAPKEWALSSEGLIVDGKASGFLYLTNSGACYLDFFITNRDSEDRIPAVSLIVNDLISRAKEIGARGIFAATRFGSLGEVVQSQGLRMIYDSTIFAKEL